MNEQELLDFRNTMWIKYCGAMKEKEDPFGYIMTKENFVLHYMMPINQRGILTKENIIPLSEKASKQIGNMLSGTVNGRYYNVEKVQEGIGQMTVDGLTVSL